jgi:hypothetical protein
MRGVAVGDFDGDGSLDLVTTGDHVNVLRGNGDGTFAPPLSSFLNTDYGMVAVGDFDRDGKLDAIVKTQTSVVLFYGTGDGSFQAPTLYPLPPTVFHLAVGDFDGNGVPDLAVANNGNISVLINVGNGSGSPRGPAGGHRDLSTGVPPSPANRLLLTASTDEALATSPNVPENPIWATVLPWAWAPALDIFGVDRFFASVTEPGHGADEVQAVKENQPRWYDDIERLDEATGADDDAGIETREEMGKGGA